MIEKGNKKNAGKTSVFMPLGGGKIYFQLFSFFYFMPMKRERETGLFGRENVFIAINVFRGSEENGLM